MSLVQLRMKDNVGLVGLLLLLNLLPVLVLSRMENWFFSLFNKSLIVLDLLVTKDAMVVFPIKLSNMLLLIRVLIPGHLILIRPKLVTLVFFNAANIGSCDVTSYVDVTSGSETALVTAILIEPIATAIDASQTSFQFYTSGVYYEPACSSTQLDHGVFIIGYGTESGSDYYIVQNMWGTDWGMEGYVLMSRNRDNNCGIATMPSYPIVQ